MFFLFSLHLIPHMGKKSKHWQLHVVLQNVYTKWTVQCNIFMCCNYKTLLTSKNRSQMACYKHEYFGQNFSWLCPISLLKRVYYNKSWKPPAQGTSSQRAMSTCIWAVWLGIYFNYMQVMLTPFQVYMQVWWLLALYMIKPLSSYVGLDLTEY